MSVLQQISRQPEKTADIDEFGAILLKFGISYNVNDPFLVVGDCNPSNKWVLYISVLAPDAIAMLQAVCPLLHAFNVPFKVLQNRDWIDRGNGLYYGIAQAGKVLAFYPPSLETIALLVDKIEYCTKHLRGQLIENCIRVGQILYYQPGTSGVPFKIPRPYRIKRRKSLIGKYYLPVKCLRFNPKGDIMLGINFKNWSVTQCLIKQAREYSFSDHCDRKSYHRLFWQKTVLQDLKHSVPVPRLIDFCMKDNDYYLITAYIEGPTLGKMVQTLHAGLSWKQLSKAVKLKLLEYFLEAVSITGKIHTAGYVHRDIQINNFLVGKECMYVIDFELAYHLINNIPQPAFGYGTRGYISPEQQSGATPQTGEDIYSLGVVLAFIILNPVSLIEFSDNIYDALVEAGIEDQLLDVIAGCLQQHPISRPLLHAITEDVNVVISDLKK
jgi:tRNA A-37 threonylcarbamoyl transferase component Bud32